MNENIYYELESNEYGWVLSVYSFDEGYIDTVDACSFHDHETLLKWQRDYEVNTPLLEEATHQCSKNPHTKQTNIDS